MRAVTLLSLLAVAASLLLPAFCPTSAHAAEGKAKATKKSSGEDLFARPSVWRFDLELPPASLEALRKDPKEYAKATVRVGDLVLKDVGVRLKGATAFQSIDKRPSLTLKFNEFVKGQDFHGRTKVALNTSLQDPSCIAPIVASEIFRAANVPAPHATFARVSLNGRDVGLYSMIEAANKDFLAGFFKKTKGNLYEGDNTDVTDKLEKDSGDDSTEQADVKALAAAAKEPDAALRWKRLVPLLDVDRFIALAAIEAMVWHHDGYAMEHNNYRLYHDPASGQMVFIVHGLDELFEKADATLTPEWKGVVAKGLLSTPEGRQRYATAVGRLATEAFQAEALTKRVDELAAIVRPTIDASTAKGFDSAAAKLRERIQKRAAYIQQAAKAVAATK